MDDFLYNVRTGNMKNMDKSNRRFDNNRYKSPNRQPARDKRKGYVNYRSLSTDQFSALKEMMAAISGNQERQTVAMEKIADLLDRLVNMHSVPDAVAISSHPSPTVMVDSADAAVEAAPSSRPMARAEMVALIHQMRNQGLSYEKIADEFESKQISTLSGRGKWRGQTIYRLFKEG
jgi:hypothetical protein